MFFTENYEAVLWMHFRMENPGLLSPIAGSSGRIRITNADLRRDFCKMWFVSRRFQECLIEAGFFSTLIIDFIDDGNEARFFDRNEPVDCDHFEHFGINLLYDELETLMVRHGSLETGVYPDGGGDEESPVQDMELTEVDGIEDDEDDFDFDEPDFDLDFVADMAPGPDAA